MKYLLSISTGFFGIGLYIVLFPMLYKLAYLNIGIAPKIQSCREHLYEKVCVSYSYFLTYLLEAPILLICFIIIAGFIAIVSLLNPKIRPNILLIGITYCIVRILLSVFGGYPITVSVLFAFIFQSVLFMLVLWVSRYLTSRSSRTNNSWLLLLRRLF